MRASLRERGLSDARLLARIKNRTAGVAVVGLGYVGLPLAARAAAAGYGVTGIDVDEQLVNELAEGRSTSADLGDAELTALVHAGSLRPTSDVRASAGADVVVVCVPTPLKYDLPDLSFLEAAASGIATSLRRGQLVILESTTYPGTTEEMFRQLLETSGLVAGEDFFLGFSPERIDPGNPVWGVANVPKIVGGIEPRSTELMAAFYGAFVESIIRVSSPRAAEMAKLLENTYRHVNIALVNEMAILCHELDIDIWEVTGAAATKPFGFQSFLPGPGWGGHCIPVDPTYLSWRVRQTGGSVRFVELARDINHNMRAHVVQRITRCLNEESKSVKGAEILVLGVAYKPNIPDVRESPALEIISSLRKAGAFVRFHDPHVPEIRLGDVVMKSVELRQQVVARADIVVVLTDHSSYDWAWIAKHARLVFDTRNALARRKGSIVRL